MDYTACYRSPLGGITLASDGEALTGLWFDGQRHYGSTLAPDHEECPALPVFEETRRWLDLYFSGVVPVFTPPLCLSGTPFRLKVWQELLEIPYGETAAYGDLANRLGCRSPQSVGSAVGHNPVSIIVPCHRVVSADGSPGGYAGGVGRKQWLLGLEKKQGTP